MGANMRDDFMSVADGRSEDVSPKAWRPIGPQEQTLTAAQIVGLFEAKTGHRLDPTNAGQAAKRLGLDVIEVEIPVPGREHVMTRKHRYGVNDLPEIFAQLQALVDRRSRWPS